MKGNCEVFERGCTGCEGLLYDIDSLKLLCETYRREVAWIKGEQMNVFNNTKG